MVAAAGSYSTSSYSTYKTQSDCTPAAGRLLRLSVISAKPPELIGCFGDGVEQEGEPFAAQAGREWQEEYPSCSRKQREGNQPAPRPRASRETTPPLRATESGRGFGRRLAPAQRTVPTWRPSRRSSQLWRRRPRSSIIEAFDRCALAVSNAAVISLAG